MNQLINLIKNTSLFRSLSKEEILALIKNRDFTIANYQKNNVLHFEGDPCKNLEIILNGTVSVERIDPSGNFLNISEFSCDDLLGGNKLFSNDPYYPMTVTAQTTVTLLVIGKRIFFDLLLQNQDILKNFLTLISDNAQVLHDKIKHNVHRTIRESIMQYLSTEQKKQNSNYIKLNITKKAMAEQMGVQRTSLSRELTKMQTEGLITYDASSITILKEIKT